MKAIHQKHKPYTLEEKKKLCAAWQKTKLSKSQFIKQNGLPSTFFGWCNTLLPDIAANNISTKQSEDNWLQVVQSEARSTQSKEIKLSNAIYMYFSDNSVICTTNYS